MTPAEHWREADLILTGDPCEYSCPHSGCVHEMRMIARAQVHATLALGIAVYATVITPDEQYASTRPGTAEPPSLLT
jgi:hypothetical protein